MNDSISRRLLPFVILLGSQAAMACDLSRDVPLEPGRLQLLEVAARIADRSDCRITLAPELARRATAVRVVGAGPAEDVLDALSAEYDLDWREEADGSITLLAYHDGNAADLESEELGIEDDALGRPVRERLAPALDPDMPSEQGPIVPRTDIGRDRVEDEALRDYSTAVMRAPGVYAMAATDAIRGISAPRLPVGLRASLVSIDGIPLPGEINYFGQFDMNLTESMSIIRAGTGLGLAFGAGAGHIAVRTGAPGDELAGQVRLLASNDFAPRASGTVRTDFAVPGLRTAVGVSGQLNDEPLDADQEPDVYQDQQVSLRWAWSSPNVQHQLTGSALKLDNAQVGGVQTPPGTCGGTSTYCPAGSDVAATGGALNYAWQIADELVVSAHGAQSDSHAAVTRLQGDTILRSPTVGLQMRFADVRADWAPTAAHAFSVGAAYSSRRRQVATVRTTFLDDVPDAIGLVRADAAAGESFVRWRRINARVFQLPQIFAEWRYDDGEQLDATAGLRQIATRSYIGDRYREIDAVNCRVADNNGPENCVDRFRENVLGPDSRDEADRTLLLANGALRWRFDDAHWVSLGHRQSFGISDYFAASSPNGAVERIDTTELAWVLPIGATQRLETRLYHHDWDRRTGVIGTTSITFDSSVLGLESEYLWQPRDHVEVWANATRLNTSTTLDNDDLVGAPDWSAGVGGRFRFGSGGYVGVHFSHVSDAHAAASDGTLTPLPSRDLLDARVGWRIGAFDVSLFGTNLLDDEYVIDQQGRDFLPEIYEAPDRMVGIDLAWRFD